MPPTATIQVEMVPITLNPIQQANLAKLIGSGALDIKDGNFTCHVDHDGHIRRIDRSDRLYSG
jgi:hypothetical protein